MARYHKVVYRGDKLVNTIPAWYHGEYENLDGGVGYIIHPVRADFISTEDKDTLFDFRCTFAYIKDYIFEIEDDVLRKLNEYKDIIKNKKGNFSCRDRKRKKTEVYHVLNPNDSKDMKDFIKWYLL